MKYLVTILTIILFSMNLNAQATKSFYDFSVKTLEGEEYDLAQLKGKKVLIVNTASRCGFTSQYEDLQKLFDEYGADNFTIIGFPANNFMHQEPGSDEKIREFCTRKFDVSFPMMSKISVKGKDMHPVYSWLTKKEENGKMDSSVKWNFQKYMVDENGELVGFVSPKTKPYDPKIISWIEGE